MAFTYTTGNTSGQFLTAHMANEQVAEMLRVLAEPVRPIAEPVPYPPPPEHPNCRCVAPTVRPAGPRRSLLRSLGVPDAARVAPVQADEPVLAVPSVRAIRLDGRLLEDA